MEDVCVWGGSFFSCAELVVERRSSCGRVLVDPLGFGGENGIIRV